MSYYNNLIKRNNNNDESNNVNILLLFMVQVRPRPCSDWNLSKYTNNFTVFLRLNLQTVIYDTDTLSMIRLNCNIIDSLMCPSFGM